MKLKRRAHSIPLASRGPWLCTATVSSVSVSDSGTDSSSDGDDAVSVAVQFHGH